MGWCARLFVSSLDQSRLVERLADDDVLDGVEHGGDVVRVRRALHTQEENGRHTGEGSKKNEHHTLWAVQGLEKATLLCVFSSP